MVKVINGNALEFTEDILIHQVNCQGVMGAGIAKQIKNKWSSVYDYYKDLCNKHGNATNELMGKAQRVVIDNNYRCVVNLFGQFNYGRNKRQTNYIALMEGLSETFNYAMRNNCTIALPYRMGCDLAGGNWDYVFNLICMLSEEYNIDVTIYKLS